MTGRVFDYSDVTPIPPPQEEGDPFFIEYTPQQATLFSLFNGLIAIPELSPRALALSEEMIEHFPSHYTAWWYKFRILEAIGYDSQNELRFINRSISTCPKLYQAWHYRRWLVDRLPEAPDEIPFLRETFVQDGKNFHAWAHALWYAERWNRRQEVFDLAKAEIARDCRNNSPWAVRRTLGLALGVDPAVEFEDTVASLRIVGKNEAACNFLFAVIQGQPELKERVRPIAEELIARSSDNQFALLLLLSVAADQTEFEQICNLLIGADPVRQPYYTLVKQGVIKPF
jgi:protein farnesyltransferase/geranylgeranyltransferase type-1 subunit alpha